MNVVVVGAGPAGAVAATLLARAGVRVRLFDRAVFPRDKICGDTLNPGAMALLERLGLADVPQSQGVPIDGMRVTGRGVDLMAIYPGGLRGRAIGRRVLDAALVEQAIRAGVEFEPGVPVRGVLRDGDAVCGVTVGRSARTCGIRTPVTIAADGRHSTLAFALGLARHPPRPRRWVAAAYFAGVRDLGTMGEMHIRAGHYIGIAPLPDGLANVCVVKPSGPGDRAFRDATQTLRKAVDSDPVLRERLCDARRVTRTAVLGPLAVDGVDPAEVPHGLLVAGDAAGFIDPMTGDGMRFAIRGGQLAARAALDALEHGWAGVPQRVADQRRAEFSRKWRLNRTLRSLVGSTTALHVASAAAPLAPAVLRALIVHAGDCSLALEQAHGTDASRSRATGFHVPEIREPESPL